MWSISVIKFQLNKSLDPANCKLKLSLKYYSNYDHLITNHSTFEKHLNTSIHRFGVEGTPDIRRFTGKKPTNGSILIGFHYHDGSVDKLAMGVLQNGKNWTTWKDSLAESNLRDVDFFGVEIKTSV